jgi:hypothetical protein
MKLRSLRAGLASAVVATAACSGQHAAPVANAPAAAPPLVGSSARSAPTPPTASSGSPEATGAAGAARLTSRSFPLPGADGAASLDFVAYERANARVWVPVGSTGSVDVFDAAGGTFTRVDGFKTAEKEAHGKKRTMGPSSAAVGDGVVYVGDRASSEVCPIDVKTLKPGACIQLPSAPDCVAYVAASREVWVTTPGAHAVAILDASKPGSLKAKATIAIDGSPEGYAVDDAHGLFFTNLEDKGGTLAIDVKTRQVKATWNAGCGADGPRGVAIDAAHDFVLVGCTDHVQVLDAAHDGARLGSLDAGSGLDNIEVLDGIVYAAAGKSARLTVARIDDKGQLAVLAVGDTAEGARNSVADGRGNVYVPDSQGARLFVFAAVPTR